MDVPPGVACLDTRHPRRLLAPEQVPMRFSIYDRPSTKPIATGRRRPPKTRGYSVESPTLHPLLPIPYSLGRFAARVPDCLVACRAPPAGSLAHVGIADVEVSDDPIVLFQ